MKKSFKPDRIAYLLYFVAGIGFIFGCRTQSPPPAMSQTPPPPQYRTIPITDSVIAEVGGLEETPKFQCYVSKTITLRMSNIDPQANIVDGQLVRTTISTRETITIEENTPGLILNYTQRPDANLGYSLNTAFEDAPGSPFIGFGKWPTSLGPSGRYQILYTDADKLIINYGGTNYNVSFDGLEPPYLLIRLQEGATENVSSRRASGLLLGK